MYCRKCGKEIEEDSFCKYCGEPAQGGKTKGEDFSFSEVLTKLREKIRVFGHERLIKAVSWIAAAVGVVNRFMHNEVEVEYSLLAQDDFFVLAEESRGFATTIMVIHIILCGLLIYDVRKKDIWVGKSMYIIFVITLLIQIAAMMLRVPAPY